MKFTLSWLKDHFETDADPATIAERLTALGLEVDALEDRAAAYGPFVVGHVVSAEPHPNADRLRVCVVDTGDARHQVVCGAPNARAGMKGVFAPPGSHIPGTGLDLKVGRIRGIESRGMLCSEREMGLSDAHEGIIELDGDPPVGAAYAKLLGLDDAVLTIGLTPDRGDCAGVRGIARDLAAGGLGRLKPLAAEPVPGAFASPTGVRFDFAPGSEDACPLFVGRTIRGLRNGPSPDWLKARLEAVGLRPISTLVDITNYFTLDRNRPLHVFDAGKLQGDLVLRLSRGGERLAALNGKDYAMPDGEICLICDDSGLVSLGGIIGGEPTGCTEGTTDVFLECALFDPARTAASGRKLKIESDARYRFERGLDTGAVVDGIEQATRLILELCGGSPSELVITGAVPPAPVPIRLRPDRAATLGGLDVPAERQREILSALGFAVAAEGGAVLATPPRWRPDVHGEADLVEEILRIEGYDAIPPVSLPGLTSVTRPALEAGLRNRRLAGRMLAARGLEEACTWSFMDERTAALFGQVPDGLRIENPIAANLSVMRPSILPNLIEAVAANADRGWPDGALFEVGPVFRDPTPKGQDMVAGGVRSGEATPRHWAVGARAVDLFDAKADALAVLAVAGAPTGNLLTTTDAPGHYHPGRSGVLRLGANVLARFGEVHPAVLRALAADGPMVAFEVFLDSVPVRRRKGGTTRPMLRSSRLQPLVRDFAFVVGEEVAAAAVMRAVRGADKTLIDDVSLFDIYRGTGLEPGTKSLALAVRLQPGDTALTDAEIEELSTRIIANVQKQTSGRLRAG